MSHGTWRELIRCIRELVTSCEALVPQRLKFASPTAISGSRTISLASIRNTSPGVSRDILRGVGPTIYPAPLGLTKPTRTTVGESQHPQEAIKQRKDP